MIDIITNEIRIQSSFIVNHDPRVGTNETQSLFRSLVLNLWNVNTVLRQRIAVEAQ